MRCGAEAEGDAAAAHRIRRWRLYLVIAAAVCASMTNTPIAVTVVSDKTPLDSCSPTATHQPHAVGVEVSRVGKRAVCVSQVGCCCRWRAAGGLLAHPTHVNVISCPPASRRQLSLSAFSLRNIILTARPALILRTPLPWRARCRRCSGGRLIYFSRLGVLGPSVKSSSEPRLLSVFLYLLLMQ